VVGHLLSCTPLPKAKRHMPICLVNGRADSVMRWHWVRRTFNRFEEAGFTQVKVQAEAEMGHDISSLQERAWIQSNLNAMITGN